MENSARDGNTRPPDLPLEKPMQNLKSEAADGVSPPSCTYMFLVLQITRGSMSAGSTGIPELVHGLLDDGCAQD